MSSIRPLQWVGKQCGALLNLVLGFVDVTYCVTRAREREGKKKAESVDVEKRIETTGCFQVPDPLPLVPITRQYFQFSPPVDSCAQRLWASAESHRHFTENLSFMLQATNIGGPIAKEQGDKWAEASSLAALSLHTSFGPGSADK